MGQIGFVMTSERAEKFFRLCLEREAVTEKERLEILTELTRTDDADAFVTEDDKDTFLQKLAGHFRVWNVSKKVK